MRRLLLALSRVFGVGALAVLSMLATVAVAAQALPDDLVEHVPGGETGVTGMLVVAIVFLGKQLLSRPSPEAHSEALKDLREARARIELLTDRAHAAETRLAVLDEKFRESRPAASGT